jgi:hypothetical protein
LYNVILVLYSKPSMFKTKAPDTFSCKSKDKNDRLCFNLREYNKNHREVRHVREYSVKDIKSPLWKISNVSSKFKEEMSIKWKK